jgi:hypothetical protein
MVVNSTFHPCHDLMVQARTFDCAGKDSLIFQWVVEIGPTSVQKIDTIKSRLKKAVGGEGGFLNLRLIDASRQVLSQNLYWLQDSTGVYTGLQHMAKAKVKAKARKVGEGRIEVSIENPAGGPLAFFLRIALVSGKSRERILPVFYRDNYVSVAPGEKQTLSIEHSPQVSSAGALVSISGWNIDEEYLGIE